MALTTDDHVEIQALVARYNHAVDSGDGAGFASTFAPDGVLDASGVVVEGQEALEKFAASLPETVRSPRHIATNLVIDGDGDRATVAAYLQMYALDGEPPRSQLMITGKYADELVRVDGGWRFARRVFVPDA